MPCSMPRRNMAVIQKTQRQAPSKKTASQEDRTSHSTRENQHNQTDGRARKQGEKGNDEIKPDNKSEKKRAVICAPGSIKSALIRNSTSHGNPPRGGPPGLRVDERLKLAKERREEHEKQLVSKELSWLAREERARRLYEQNLGEKKRRLQEQREKEEKRRTALERREEQRKQLVSRERGRLAREERALRHYEQLLEERKRKLREQREKEERRRAAVEEKRRQRMKEETERCESAVKKTLEQSHRAKQRLSREGSYGKKTNNKSAPRCSPLTAWEKALVCRLLTPTCSYLSRSRSRSHGGQAGDEVVHVCPRSVKCHSMPATATSIHKPPHRHAAPDHHRALADLRADPRPVIQTNYQVAASHNSSPTSQRPVSAAQLKAANEKENENMAMRNRQEPHIPNSPVKALPTNPLPDIGEKALPTNPLPDIGEKVLPTNPESRPDAPSTEQPVTRQRSVIRHLPWQQMDLELEPVPEEDAPPAPNHTLSPGNTRPTRASATWDQVQPFQHSVEPQTLTTHDTEEAAVQYDHIKVQAAPPESPSSPRPSAGTMDPEEASRLLAEKRREARLRRERDEVERRSREESEHRRTEERARLETEAQGLVEERKKREEEERALRATQEAALQEKQREEETQARERAELQSLEREKHFQKEEQQRQERKKRLELIMRRTRKPTAEHTETLVLNGNSTGNSSPEEPYPKENTKPVKKNNSCLEEVIQLGVGKVPKPSQLSLNELEDTMVPVVAFKERRSLRTLTGIEDIQSHQRAEVI
ncbi:hypothetical protein UPYG_G00232190 [Umbra pygmaea]|uniref:AD domain-containing protein n=1 Tax=Umbra pygmaea TaxID=75934 RepID=A0ABD0WDN6_UMBPY